jgi:hypothetical protein
LFAGDKFMADGPSRRDWRAGAAVPAQGATSKSSSVFVAGLAAVALLGALVGFLYWLLAGGDASVRYINIPLCEYVNPVWPPVPFAEADADRLVKHFNGGEKAFNDQEEERFRRKLESLKSLGDRPLVLHISGLAIARDNQVYLLSSKAGPGLPDNNWHSLDEVFKAVSACPSKNKLLILDIAQPLADPARGVLADNASAQVTTMVRAMANDNKLPGLVLVTAGPGEYSQGFDEQRATAFAYFMDQALLGHADGYGDGVRDSWVKVREMAAYVRDQVARWSYYSRGVTQTVTLYGEGDFRLTSHERPAELPEADFKPMPVAKWIGEAWTLRDQWEAEAARVKAPHLLRQLETAILRAEARGRAGWPDDRVQRELSDARAGLTATWDKLKAVQPPPKVTLVGAPTPTALLAKLEGWLAAYDGKKKFGETLGDPKPKPEEVLLAAWVRLADTPVTRDRAAALCVEAVPPGSQPELAEGVFLSKLGALAAMRAYSTSERPWPGETACAAVKAEHAMLEAVTAAGDAPEAFRWSKPRLDDIDKKRSEAEAVLWTLGNDGLVGAASAAARVAMTYRDIEKQSNDIRDEARRYAQAQKAITDALAELPGMAALFGRLNRGDVRDAPEQWGNAVDAATTLADAFDKSTTPSGELLTNQTAALNAAMASLRSRVVELSKRDPDGRFAPALLAMPRMTAKDREAWWAGWRKWTAGKDQWLAENQERTKPGEVPTPGDWAGSEFEKATRRARMAIDLGRLCGQSVGPLFTETVDLATRSDAAIWNDFAPKLLHVFAPPANANSPAADRTGRVFGTTDAPARASAKNRKEFWTWSAERYESEARSRGLGRLPFYLKAVQDARAAADIARNASGL